MSIAPPPMSPPTRLASMLSRSAVENTRRAKTQFAEAGSEALNLIFQSPQHVHLRPVGNMAISPGRVFACRGARGIEQTRLRQQDKWAIWVLPVAHRFFRGSNLLKASAQVHRRRAQAPGSLPRDGSAQCIVHFENARPVTVSLQPTPVTVGSGVLRTRQEVVAG